VPAAGFYLQSYGAPDPNWIDLGLTSPIDVLSEEVIGKYGRGVFFLVFAGSPIRHSWFICGEGLWLPLSKDRSHVVSEVTYANPEPLVSKRYEMLEWLQNEIVVMASWPAFRHSLPVRQRISEIPAQDYLSSSLI